MYGPLQVSRGFDVETKLSFGYCINSDDALGAKSGDNSISTLSRRQTVGDAMSCWPHHRLRYDCSRVSAGARAKKSRPEGFLVHVGSMILPIAIWSKLQRLNALTCRQKPERSFAAGGFTFSRGAGAAQTAPASNCSYQQPALPLRLHWSQQHSPTTAMPHISYPSPLPSRPLVMRYGGLCTTPCLQHGVAMQTD